MLSVCDDFNIHIIIKESTFNNAEPTETVVTGDC